MADPQAALRQWIIEGLKRKGHGSGRELARHIGIEPEVLTRMKNTDGLKETRRIEAHMIPAIADYFGSIPPGFEHMAKLRCIAAPTPAMKSPVSEDPKRDAAMPERPKGVTINIETPQQGTLVVGNNNTVTLNNRMVNAAGASLSIEQALKLDSDVKEVAAARKADPESVMAELCAALHIADASLITKASFPAVETILHGWREQAVRDAVNDRG